MFFSLIFQNIMLKSVPFICTISDKSDKIADNITFRPQRRKIQSRCPAATVTDPDCRHPETYSKGDQKKFHVFLRIFYK